MSSFDIEDERTDEKPKSRYLTKKDLIVLLIVVCVLLVLLYPVYIIYKGNTDKHMCQANFKQMFNGVNLYAEENNQRLPPVYATSETDAPLVRDGAVYSWVDLIGAYVKDKSAFTCPSARIEEGVSVHSNDGGKLSLTYGMYAPLGGEPLNQIDDPGKSVLLGETNNMGAEHTLDPLPFKDAAGNVVPYDGFVIGFDDSNLLPTKNTKFVSRLAFPDTANLSFALKGPARHRDGIHVLSVDGRLRTITPNFATYQDESGNVSSLWRISKSRRFRE